MTYVPRSEYDALKAKYEALVASGVSVASASKRSRASASRQPTVHVDDELAGMDEGELVLVEEKVGGRKKRSMKLEVGLRSAWCILSRGSSASSR